MDYTWLDGQYAEPPAKWNAKSQVGQRTNNIQGWHSKVCPKKIAEHFKIKQASTEVKIRQGGTARNEDFSNCAKNFNDHTMGWQVNLYFCIINKSDQTDQKHNGRRKYS